MTNGEGCNSIDWTPSDRNLYNSYFYLAGDPNTSVLEKLRLHGARYTSTLDGGVGCHINLSDHLTKEQYIKIIDYAVEQGCSYWTFNIPNSQCQDCGFVAKRPFDVCPKCGSKNIYDYTRIIGYLRPVQKFDNARKWEAENRRVYLDGKDI